jgi:hemerythrin-like domain-containing protein
MNTDDTKPNLVFVELVHQSLRIDAARLDVTVATLDADDEPSRLPAIRGFFEHYRGQLLMHHSHEDSLFFPALAAKVGTDTIRLGQLTDQHQALDTALQAVGDGLAALAGNTTEFPAGRSVVSESLATMAELLDAHLTLEEDTVLPLYESQIPVAEHKQLETKARQAAPRAKTQFLIPWVVAHATPQQRKALFKSTPPFRLVNLVTGRRYRRIDRALLSRTVLNDNQQETLS